MTQSLASLSCVPFLILSFCAASVSADEKTAAGKVAIDWDSLFHRNEGWTGGDVVGTIDLKDGRLLWVFGDTWIGKIENGKHAADAKLINNSAAIQQWNARDPAKTPTELQFLVGQPTEKGNATAWIVDPAIPGDKPGQSWFWTTGGGITVQRGDRSLLYVFLFRVQKGSGQDDVWNFRVVGTTMAVFDDIRQPVEKWRPRLIDIPFSFDRPADSSHLDPQWAGWGVSALSQATNDRDEILIYGVRRHSKHRDDLLLAKMPLTEIEDFHRWKFFVKQDQWTDHANEAQPVAENVTKELSVERSNDGSRYLMVHSEPVLGPGIFLRTAPDPAGPWSKPLLIHRVTDKAGDRRFFAYAAKGHVLLSNPGELFVTYVVNSHDFSAMFNDAGIYRPRCLRINLSD